MQSKAEMPTAPSMRARRCAAGLKKECVPPYHSVSGTVSAAMQTGRDSRRGGRELGEEKLILEVRLSGARDHTHGPPKLMQTLSDGLPVFRPSAPTSTGEASAGETTGRFLKEWTPPRTVWREKPVGARRAESGRGNPVRGVDTEDRGQALGERANNRRFRKPASDTAVPTHASVAG